MSESGYYAACFIGGEYATFGPATLDKAKKLGEAILPIFEIFEIKPDGTREVIEEMLVGYLKQENPGFCIIGKDNGYSKLFMSLKTQEDAKRLATKEFEEGSRYRSRKAKPIS